MKFISFFISLIDYQEIFTNSLQFYYIKIPLLLLFFFINCLYCLGLTGLISNSSNLIKVLLNLEIILLANGLNFIVWSLYLHDFTGEIYALMLLAVAVAETSVGLALLLCSAKLKAKIHFNYYSNLRG